MNIKLFLYKAVFNLGQREVMSSGSREIPGVWKARTGKKGVETMMTELDKLKEFAICSVDEFRDQEIRMAETTLFAVRTCSVSHNIRTHCSGLHIVGKHRCQSGQFIRAE